MSVPSDFRTDVRDWVALDDKLLKAKRVMEKVKSKKNDISSNITKFIEKNNFEKKDIKISNSRLKYRKTTKITPLSVKERLIPAMGYGEIDAQIILNGTLLQAIGDPENERNYRLVGMLTAKGQYLGMIPIYVKLDLTDLIT